MDEDYCLAGSGKPLPESMIRPSAWELPREEIDDKSLHILRLIGFHVTSMKDENKDKIINLLNEILEIKPLKKVSFIEGTVSKGGNNPPNNSIDRPLPPRIKNEN